MADEEFTARARWKFVVQVIVSAIVLGASLFVILNNAYPDATMKWAFGGVGLIVGYWLR